MSLYEKIKKLCVEHKTTIATLERECGLGNGAIRWWENADPRYSSLKKVATRFGMTVDQLMEGE